MAFTNKVESQLRRPNEDSTPKEEVPGWMIYAARALGMTGGFFIIIYGLWNLLGIITLNILSVLAGTIQIAGGLLTLLIEGPNFGYGESVREFVHKKPNWNRALFYIGLAVITFLMNYEIKGIFGVALIFMTGVLYGMMSLGKKASSEEMRQNATV